MCLIYSCATEPDGQAINKQQHVMIIGYERVSKSFLSVLMTDGIQLRKVVSVDQVGQKDTR